MSTMVIATLSTRGISRVGSFMSPATKPIFQVGQSFFSLDPDTYSSQSVLTVSHPPYANRTPKRAVT